MNTSSRYILVVALTLSSIFTISAFNNINDLLNYTRKVREFPDSDLDLKGVLAQVNPTFHVFYPTIDPGFFGKLACKFNLFKPLWCFSDFMNGLKSLYNEEKKRSQTVANATKTLDMNSQEARVIGCCATEGVAIIIVGELSGALHSLTRIIEHWLQNDIMDETFKIKDAKTQIIFLGDLVGTSAYNLEILTLIATIIEKNPHNAWYLCGSTEDKQAWMETPLTHAILVRSNLNRSQLRDTYQLIDSTFALLPKAFILTSPSKETAIILAAHQTFDAMNINEITRCGRQLTDPHITSCAITNQTTPEVNKIILSALIENRRIWSTAFITPPVATSTLPSINGTVWDIVSGTTRALHATYLFRWYGYFILTPHGTNLADSTLEYIGKHVGIEDTFQSRAIYNIVTGKLLSS